MSTEHGPIKRIPLSDRAAVSVIVPSVDGDRGGNVSRLLDDLRGQTCPDMEVIVVVAVKPQGAAINQGVSAARGSIIVICDDDSRLARPEVIENMVGLLRDDDGIGMVGASIRQPPDANRFQSRVAREFPRMNMPVVDAVTDSDMACHGCCALRKSVFEAVGREREDIVRGLDPDLRQRLRRAGYRVVLAPQTVAYHPLPATLRGFMRQSFRNGRGSAYAQRHQPEFVYDTAERTEWIGEALKRPCWKRLAIFPLRSLGYLLTGRFLRVPADAAYAAGYACEWLRGDRSKQAGAGT